MYTSLPIVYNIKLNNRAIYATAINRNEIENSAVSFKLQRSLEIIKIN